MSLSDKIDENDEDTMETYDLSLKEKYFILADDVKEAVKELKDGRLDNLSQEIQNEIIDKIFGEKLI